MKKILLLLAFAGVATMANVCAQIVDEDDDMAGMSAENRYSGDQEDEDDEAGM